MLLKATACLPQVKPILTRDEDQAQNINSAFENVFKTAIFLLHNAWSNFPAGKAVLNKLLRIEGMQTFLAFFVDSDPIL